MIQTKRNGEWFQMDCPPSFEGITVDYLFRVIWQAPKKQIHQFRMQKEVKVNEVEAHWNKPLQLNDRIEIKLFSSVESEYAPYPYNIQVLFEDDHLLIVNKPAAMDTHPNQPGQSNTLVNAVTFYLQEKGEQCRVLHIHRLDHDTTGVILFAKHSLAGAILDRMLEHRTIKRTYLALVHGKLAQKMGTISEPIGRDRHHATRRRVSKTGQNAITHFEVIQTNLPNQLSFIKCQLDTGRTHQIRVHFSHLGHPLAGDTLYGGKPIFQRQALHAAQLSFIHPFTDEKISCHAPFIDKPAIFQNIPHQWKDLYQ